MFTHSSKNNIRGNFFGKRKFLVLFCRKWVLLCTQIHYAILHCEVTGGGRNLGFQWLFIGRELFKDWFKNDTTHFIGLSSAQELALSNFHIKVACLNFPPWQVFSCGIIIANGNKLILSRHIFFFFFFFFFFLRFNKGERNKDL